MKAIVVRGESLSWEEVEDLPTPGPKEVRIKVCATAVNRADLLQRSGKYPPPPGITDILGLECSGTVLEVGSEVSWPGVGEPVCALLAGGGYAEEVVVPAGLVLPVPKGVSLVEAAALPEVFTTAWLNLRLEGALSHGTFPERVLVHAGASGVGTAAIQLCVAWGNPVAVTVGSANKVEFCRALGAELALDRHAGPWFEQIKAWGGVDLILDPVGGSYLDHNISVLRNRGRLVIIGVMGGTQGTLALGRLLVKRLSVKGSVLRSRSVAEKTEILQGVKKEVWPLFEAGLARPIVEEILAIQMAEEAHQLLASNRTMGKVLLRVD